MQKSDIVFIEKKYTLTEEDIDSLIFRLVPGDRVFLTGDLGSGKSTLTRALLHRHFDDDSLIVRSPTYTYYQRYAHPEIHDVYHFDLYRVESREDIFLIGAEDILRDPDSICIIEWPEILGETVVPTHRIHIDIRADGQRDYTIQTRQNN